jgi:hypothetical protein
MLIIGFAVTGNGRLVLSFLISIQPPSSSGPAAAPQKPLVANGALVDLFYVSLASRAETRPASQNRRLQGLPADEER